MDPALICHALPEGWHLPPDGAVITNPPSPRVSAKHPPSSPAACAIFVLPGTLASLILYNQWMPPDGVVSMYPLTSFVQR